MQEWQAAIIAKKAKAKRLAALDVQSHHKLLRRALMSWYAAVASCLGTACCTRHGQADRRLQALAQSMAKQAAVIAEQAPAKSLAALVELSHHKLRREALLSWYAGVANRRLPLPQGAEHGIAQLTKNSSVRLIAKS